MSRFVCIRSCMRKTISVCCNLCFLFANVNWITFCKRPLQVSSLHIARYWLQLLFFSHINPKCWVYANSDKKPSIKTKTSLSAWLYCIECLFWGKTIVAYLCISLRQKIWARFLYIKSFSFGVLGILYFCLPDARTSSKHKKLQT